MQRNDKIIYALYLSMWVKIYMCLPLNTFESDNAASFFATICFLNNVALVTLSTTP